MRRKELQRKMQAVAMAAVVTLTTVGAPATAFAEEFPMETTVTDFSDNGEAETEETVGDDFSDGEDLAVQSNADQEAAAPVTQADAEDTTDEQAAAREYLKTNYIDGSSRITVTSGNDGFEKSDDGLTYDVGLTTPRGSSVTSLRLKLESSTSNYKSGWYIEDNPYIEAASATASRHYIDHRPTVADGPYSFTATLKLFAKDTESSAIDDGTATALATQDFTIILAPEKAEYTVNIKPVNAKTGEAIADATVDIEQNYDSLKPSDDGSYTLTEGEEYTLTVTADGYDKYTQTFTPSASGDMEVKLSPIVYRNTTFAVTGSDGTAITDADISVKEGYYTTLKPQEDGSYKLQAGKEYKYTITKDGYKEASGSFTVPDETGDYVFPVTLESNIDSADQAVADAVKKTFDAEIGTLRPVYGTDSNIASMVLGRVQKYNLDGDASKVKVSLDTTDNADYIASDGTINYVKSGFNSTGVYSQNVSCTFKFTYGTATAVSDSRTVIVGWDQKYFKGQMQSEADQLTWDSIKGSNESQEDVASDLTLPGCMGSSMRNVWSTITWESSDPDVISIQKPSIDSPVYPSTGKINPKAEDTTVTLTATFKANETVLNTNVEKVDSFGTITKTFTVTVKGTGNQGPTEEELKALLDKYYTAESLQDFNSKEQLDTSNCTGDIQLPRYTRIKDENGEYVFNNKEITVTSSDEKLFTVNGYKVTVDMLAYDKDTTANLIVTFTRDGVTAVKEIPITVSVKGVNEELDKELAAMDYAKAHYFDGIKGDNADADNIITDLHPFQEMYLNNDGNAVWVYNADDKTGTGIAPDDYFTDSWEMEGAGYNHFKSSNNAIIQHENLVVIRPESDTKVTISTLLSSEKYGQSAKDHSDNEKLQKLYKQEVSVTVTVKGTKEESEALNTKIQEAKSLLETITEGTEAGQYPEGTKKTLEDAIAAAQAVADNAESTAAQKTEAITALTKAMKDCQASRIPQAADVTVITNIKGNTAGETQKITVKATDAALYGYTKPEGMESEVTVLDALVDLHVAMYGEAFKAAPENYLVVGTKGWIEKIFETINGDVGFLVNNEMPGNAMCNNAVLKSGDVVNVFVYNDKKNYKDEYLYFDTVSSDIMAKKDFTLTVKGRKAAESEAASVQKDITVELRDSAGNAVATAVTDEKGVATFKVAAEGTYTAVITKTPYEYYIPVNAEVVVKAHEHSFGEWVKVSDATVFAPEKQESTCNLCGEKRTREVGEKLAPTITLSKTEVTLNLKDSATVEVTGLANGDSVKNWESSNTDIVTVDQNGKITSGTKEGKATVTVTLASGKKAEIAVIVKESEHVYTKWTKVSDATVFAPEKQESTCDLCGQKTTREVGEKLEPTITLSKTEVTLNLKESETIKVTGLANGDSVSNWVSSNTNIATVDQNGKITAGNNKGKATVTVTLASKKKAQISVTVTESEHVYTKWTKVSDATVFAPEKQESTCDLCGQKTTREVGEKLEPTVTLSKTEVTLNLKDSTTVEATGLANGDSVESWESSDTSIVTVDQNGKITSGTKEGKVTVTVTLASGKKAEIAVTVKENEHVYTKWTKVSDATVFAPEKQESTCDLCGQKTTREVGEKLEPTVTLSKTEVTLNLKDSTTVEATGLANGDSVESWESSDTSIVTIDQNGKITSGTKEGKVTVTVTLASGKKAEIAVTVKENEHVYTKWTKVSDATVFAPEKQESTCDLCGQKTTREVGEKLEPTVTLSKTEVTLNLKDSTTVEATGLANGDSVESWTSSDTGIVTVDQNGKIVSGTKEGKATVTVTLASGKKAEIAVTVKESEHVYTKWTKVSDATVFAPEKQQSTCDLCGQKTTREVGKKLTPTVKLSKTTLTLGLRRSITVKATGLAKGDSVKTWTSSNRSIATVDKNGKITATSKEGKATITVKLASGKTAKVVVTVKLIRTTKLTNVPKTLSLTVGKKYTLKPVVTPSNTQEKVTYKSSNTKIATVSSTGIITAKKVGTATITVKSGKRTATVKVTVKKAPALKAIKNVPTKKTLAKGKTYTLKPQLYPAGAIAKITYTSSNKSVATVDAKGKITAKKKGTAVITVKAGKFTAKCKVTVK